MKPVYIALIFAFVSITGSADSGGEIAVAGSVLNAGILQGIAAKEICTCMYEIRMGDSLLEAPSNQKRLNLCMARASLPVSTFILKQLMYIDVDSVPNEVIVTTQLPGEVIGQSVFNGKKAVARFFGDSVGCRLFTDEELKSLRF